MGREEVGENDWGEDFQDDEEEVQLRREVGEEGEEEEKEGEVGRLSALYPYSGEEEGTLALEPGQQFRWGQKCGHLPPSRFQYDYLIFP